MRHGAGPVFAYEWLLTTRRWQLYAMRAGFLLVILAGMYFAIRDGAGRLRDGRPFPVTSWRGSDRSFYLAIVSIELAIVLLVAPAVTAGAICLDKARGTLDHMLVTDLSNAEIVLGKLGVRLIPVLGLDCLRAAAHRDLLAPGRNRPHAHFRIVPGGNRLRVLGCSLASTLSVWGRKPQDVLMLTYLIITIWLFCRYLTGLAWTGLGFSSLAFFMGTVSDLIDYMNPFYLVWAPYLWSRNVSLLSYLAFLAGCLIISGVLAGLATVRIRKVAQTRFNLRPTRSRRPWFAARTAKPRRSLLPGPSLDGNPVFWREWYRSKPSRVMRLVWFVYWGIGLVFVVLAFGSVVSGNTNRHMIAIMNRFSGQSWLAVARRERGHEPG